MKSLLLSLTLLLAVPYLHAQDTTRRGLRAKKADKELAAAPAVTASFTDTIVMPKAHTLDISGYDKPLRSRRETFFASNNADASVEAISFTVTYFDRSNRQLHKRAERIDISIPAGETRQVSFKSWDTQLAFYYINSPVPARAQQATPYEVKISIDTLFVNR